MQYSKLLTSIFLLTPTVLLAADVKKPTKPAAPAAKKPLAKLTPQQQERIQRKVQNLASQKFDQPDVAQDFFAASRTGPIITRGPNATTAYTPLNHSSYLPAINQMASMPRFNTGTRSVMPADNGAKLPFGANANLLGAWQPLGPTNQGGRTRSLIIDPNTPNTMYIGGVDGGVWKTTDGGATWSTVTDLQMSNLSVVSLAFEPGNTSTIYAGTGEGFRNGDAIRGAGIFKSTDAGVTWTQLAGTNTSDFYYSMRVMVSPRNVNRIYTATRTGFWRSIDGGTSWTKLFDATAVAGCTDTAMQVNRASGYVFVSCGNIAQGTIYRGLDSNTSTFSSVMSLAGQGRSSLALAPSNESILYVMSAQATNGGGAGTNSLHGLYRSISNGNPGTFTTQLDGKINYGTSTTAQKIPTLLLSNPVIGLLTECGFGTSSFSNQGWYDNVLAVDPVDPNRVWAGGIDLWRSDDGGASWGTTSYWWFTKGTNPQYKHADQHGLVFHPNYNGTTNKILFSASDGGLNRTDDARAVRETTLANICGTTAAGDTTWVDLNNGYQTTQFYDGAVYPDGLTYFGGLQDNGTTRGVNGNTNWSVLNGGDGGYVAVDTLGDANAANDVLFLETTGLSIRKSVDGGGTFAAATTGITNSGFLFTNPFFMNQGTKTQLWTGGFDIWRTTNQAVSWVQAATTTCGLGSVSAIATHPSDGNRVLVGMSDGCLNYNTSALTATSATAWPSSTVLASNYISWLAWDPTNVNVAYATISRFAVNNVFKTTDGGATWTAIVGSGATAIPQIPARTIVVNPADPNQLFVGTDLGVFTSVDAGVTWLKENTNFANVSVNALVINETAPYNLFAFTHGRGAWRTVIFTGGAVTSTTPQ